MKRKMCTFTMVMLLAAGAPHGQEHARPVDPEVQKKPIVDSFEPLTDGSCAFNFGSGSGPTRLGWCVSPGANLVKLESPASVFHLRQGLREGYALCTSDNLTGDTVVGFDNGVSSDGFDAPLLLAVSSSTVSIRRLTTDRVFQIDHTFTRDPKEMDITVNVSIKNISGGPVFGQVVYTRFADLDVGGDGSDDIMDRSNRGVWARDLKSGVNGDGVALTATTFGTPAFSTALLLASTGMKSCLSGSALTPIGPADTVAQINYDLGSFEPGQTKKIAFTYRRQ
jgi:hypothetical protein